MRKAKAKFSGVEPSSSPNKGTVISSDRTKTLEGERLKVKEKEEKRTFREILKNKRDPRRSVYFDEVWNPYGLPPPGLPWTERDSDDSEGRCCFFIIHFILHFVLWFEYV